MDSYALKLSGKAELSKPLKVGNNFGVALQGAIISETISDNEDGTKSHTFLFKPVLVEVVNELGERLRAKDIRSRSQQLRSVLWKKWEVANEPIEFNEFYDREMLRIIQENY